MYEDLCGFQIVKDLSSELLNMEKTYDFVIKPFEKCPPPPTRKLWWAYFAWGIIAIKAFLMQNLRLIALLVLEIWCHKISLGRREWVSNSTIYPAENGFNLKKIEFLCSESLFLTQNWPSMSISVIFKQKKILHSQNFWNVSMRKEQKQPPWFIKFAKILSERVLRIKAKIHKVRAPKSKRILINSCKSGHPVIQVSEPPPPPPPQATLFNMEEVRRGRLYRFFLFCLKTACIRKMKLADFWYLRIGCQKI